MTDGRRVGVLELQAAAGSSTRQRVVAQRMPASCNRRRMNSIWPTTGNAISSPWPVSQVVAGSVAESHPLPPRVVQP